MRSCIAALVAALFFAFARSSEAQPGFLDVLRVGDRVALKFGSRTEIVFGSDEEIDAMLPTDEERREYESLEASGVLPLPDLTDREAMREALEENAKRSARRAELRSKATVKAARLTAVGRDFVALSEEDGRTARLPVHDISRITGPADLLAERAASAPVAEDATRPTGSKFLGVLSAGDRVVVRLRPAGIDFLIGMEADLKDTIATADERREYAQLEAAAGETPVFPRPGIGDRNAIEEMRRRTQERAEHRERLNKLKPKMEYQLVTLTEVGDDYVAFDSAEGFLTYLPVHRIASVTKRAAAAAPDAAAPPNAKPLAE